MKVIYTIYQYIFYKCFRAAWLGNRNWLNLSKEEYTYDVARSAWFAITVILIANFALLFLLIGTFKGYYLLDYMANSSLAYLFFSLSLINYFIFLYKKNIKKSLKCLKRKTENRELSEIY